MEKMKIVYHCIREGKLIGVLVDFKMANDWLWLAYKATKHLKTVVVWQS